MPDAQPTVVWIVSGPGGAGKSTALAALEDAGHDAVDNLPLELLASFVSMPRTRGAVAVLDTRQGGRLTSFDSAAGARVLFLDARDDVLARRVGDRRRAYRPAGHGTGHDAIRAERLLLTPLRAAADTVIDTSELTPEQLGERVRTLVGTAEQPRLLCTVSSFGYKYGAQIEADWVVDSRVMRSPFWEPSLRALSGLDSRVRDFVLAQEATKDLLDRLVPLVSWANLRAAEHYRRFLHVAIGCTGGHHRSVVIAEQLAARLREAGMEVEVRHRDVWRADAP